MTANFSLRHFATVTLLLSQFILSAQKVTISGSVKDSDTKDAITGAIVKLDSKRSTLTDASGVFKLEMDQSAGDIVLSVSYMGYKTQKLTIAQGKADKRIEVLLQSQSFQLNEVVTSSFYKKNAAKESVSMEVITKNQIKNTNANDLGDIVSKTPGVLVQDGQISIRGGSSFSYGVGTRTAVLVDNLGFSSNDLAEGQSKLVPVENAKQVEVIKGASSVVYGSSALNGVVNVITEWPTQTEPQTNVDVNMVFFDSPPNPIQKYYEAGTPFGINTNINHQRRVKDLQIVAGGNITGAQGFLQYSNEFRTRYFLKTRHLNPKIEGLNYGLNFSQMYEKSDRFFISQDVDTFAYFRKTGSEDEYLRTTIDPHLSYQNPKGHRVSVNGRYLHIWRNGNGNDINVNSNSIEFQPQYQYTLKNILVLTAGIPFTTGFSRSNLYPGLRTNYNVAAYAQAEVNYKFLSWTGGMRYEVIGVDTFVEATRPVFRTGVNLKAGRASFFRASWGQGYRVPSIGERFVSAEFSAGVYVIPNPELLTESGWSFEVGFKQGFQIKNWKAFLDAAFFWQEYNNFVQYEIGYYKNRYSNGNVIFPNEGEFIIGMRADNVENARVTGYEASLVSQGKIGPVGLQILAGYTYTYPTNLSDTTSDPSRDIRKPGNYLRNFFELNGRRPDSIEASQMLTFRNRHLFRADIEVTYWKAYIGATLFYASYPDLIPPLFKAASIVLFNGGERSLNKYSADHANGDFVFDLRAGLNLTDKFRVGFIVKNVANKHYSLRPGRAEPNRNFTLQLRYTF
jgi:outer membrane receptor protein involved in Fe transport